jgi:hypothetical protein
MLEVLMTTPLGRLPAVVAGLVLVAACGGDLTLPDSSVDGFTLDKVRGDGQTGPVGEVLPEPLVVKVLSRSGKPVLGQEVHFSFPEGESGDVQPAVAVTNSAGDATVQWVLGTVPGEHQLEARLPTDEPTAPMEVFLASAVAANPDTLRPSSPLFQPGRRGQTLPDPLVVTVVDRFGNGVSGVAVEWREVAGGGQVSASQTLTEADGTARVIWTLGGGIGVQKVTATLSGATGSPVTFSATVLF